MSLFDAARAAGVPFASNVQPRSGSILVKDLRLKYLDWGFESNPTLLLLHGFAQTAHSWDFVALSLCDRFRVVALDQRGHGDSDWSPDGDYSTESAQADVHAVAHSLSAEPVILVGLSMGGRIASSYASLHPERVRGLVIVDAGPEMQRSGTGRIRRFTQQSDEMDSVEEFVERVRKYNPSRPVEQIRGSILHNIKQLPNGRWTWKYDRRLGTGGPRVEADPALTARLWAQLGGIACPTLIIRGGDSDVLAPETAQAMEERIPDARLATIEGAGHLVPGDNPIEFIREVSKFLGEVVSG